MNKSKESKLFSSCSEIKTAIKSGDDNSMTFSGYGAYFGNVDSYGDVIAPGAFKDAIEQMKATGEFPAMLAQHGMDTYTPVGVYTEIREDEKGLYVEGKLADTQMGRDLYALMKMTPRPAIKGMSIGFFTKEAEYKTAANASSFPEGCDRIIKSVDLMEISLVTFPANKKATVQSVKSEFVVRDAEKALREAGYSASEAKTIISIIKQSVTEEEGATMTHDEKGEAVQKIEGQQVVTPAVQDEEEVSDELKSAIAYLKDLYDPESSGMELSEEEKGDLKTWLAEQKKASELEELRNFLVGLDKK